MSVGLCYGFGKHPMSFYHPMGTKVDGFGNSAWARMTYGNLGISESPKGEKKSESPGA